MPEPVKCWIDPDGFVVQFLSQDEDIPAIAVPLDLMERMLCVVADMEVTEDERADMERLCREMREEVGHA